MTCTDSMKLNLCSEIDFFISTRQNSIKTFSVFSTREKILPTYSACGGCRRERRRRRSKEVSRTQHCQIRNSMQRLSTQKAIKAGRGGGVDWRIRSWDGSSLLLGSVCKEEKHGRDNATTHIIRTPGECINSKLLSRTLAISFPSFLAKLFFSHPTLLVSFTPVKSIPVDGIQNWNTELDSILLRWDKGFLPILQAHSNTVISQRQGLLYFTFFNIHAMREHPYDITRLAAFLLFLLALPVSCIFVTTFIFFYYSSFILFFRLGLWNTLFVVRSNRPDYSWTLSLQWG